MHPVCFKIGGFTINWYGVMMALGFFAGLANWSALGRRERRDFNYCSDLLFWIMVSGILGARLAYVAANAGHFFRRPWLIVRVDQGGLIYYGGLLSAILALALFARARREKLTSLLDFVATSLPLAHFFGRIGCFLNGCCHGKTYDGFFAVSFPADSLAWWRHVDMAEISRLAETSLGTHPVQLYEAAFNLTLYFVLVWAYRRRTHDGSVMTLYLLIYPIGRFLLEFLRGDERMCMAGLTIAQWISLALFAAGCCLTATALAANGSEQSPCRGSGNN